MRTLKTERRIDGKVRLMRIAGVLCALFAAAGIANGMHEANPTGGWLVPAFAGVVAAAAFAIFWHIVIGGVIGMVRLSTTITLFAVATIVTAIALGASAQAIATAVAGRAALSAELSNHVERYNTALADAYSEATSWRGVADAATVLAAGFRAQADLEAGGSHGTGKGQGPKWASLVEAAESFGSGANAMNEMLGGAKDDQARGESEMQKLRDAAARGDQTAFMNATGELGSIIAKLNAVDPKPIIANTGMVTASKDGIDLTKETADFQAKAEKAMADRQTVDVPLFTPLSLGEATRNQAFGAAAHGWILAGAIDVLPLFFLVLAFALSREVWLNEEVVRDRLTAEGRDETDRKKLDSLMGRPTVVPFRDAAE